MSDSIRQAINQIRSDAEVHVQEIKASAPMTELARLLKALNALEELSGDQRTSLGSLIGLEDATVNAEQSVAVAVGEFYGLEPLEAAKRYLRKRGKPTTFDAIVAGIEAGSCEVTNRAQLKLSLARSTFEIAKLSEDSFGLLEWYPHVKRSPLRKRPVTSGASEGTQEVTEEKTVAADAVASGE